MEFYEDYFEANPEPVLDGVGPDGDVQFVTGDPEYDDLERRLSSGEIGEEEIAEILLKWESPKEQLPEHPTVDDFEDVNPMRGM